MVKNKIGVGVVTYNREDQIERVLNKINSHTRVVVNDGTPYNPSVYPKGWEVITHPTNKCVAAAKNTALKYLIDQGCEYLFIIEDDILVKDEDVFNKYIETANITGVQHLMYGYHGPANKKPGTQQVNPRLVIKYKDESDNKVDLWLNTHCVGGFCYYHAGVIKNVGYMDENFKNAWEHVEHSYRIVKAGLLPAYWFWPDIAESPKYLDEIACSEDSSVIRPREDWQENIVTGGQYFKSIHGWTPWEITEEPYDKVFANLEFIKQNYSR